MLNMFSHLSIHLRPVLDFIFPKICGLCEKRGDFICPDCEQTLKRIGSSHCAICGMPFAGQPHSHQCGECLLEKPSYTKHRSVFYYDERISTLIFALKYHAQFWVMEIFSEYLKERIGEFSNTHLIVPVPLHDKKLRQRGFNQSLLLAQSVAKVLHKPIETKYLTRAAETHTQVGFDRTARQENLKNAFALQAGHIFREKNILLIDDVRTTGTTLNEVAKILKQGGAASVEALTLAMVVPHYYRFS